MAGVSVDVRGSVSGGGVFSGGNCGGVFVPHAGGTYEMPDYHISSGGNYPSCAGGGNLLYGVLSGDESVVSCCGTGNRGGKGGVWNRGGNRIRRVDSGESIPDSLLERKEAKEKVEGSELSML